MNMKQLFLAALIIANSHCATFTTARVHPTPKNDTGMRNPLFFTANNALSILNTWDEDFEWADGKLIMRGLRMMIEKDASEMFQQIMDGIIGDRTKENRFLYFWNAINAPKRMKPKIRAVVIDTAKWPLLLKQFGDTDFALLRASLSLSDAAAMPEDSESDAD